ncbi:MAG: hypothetical protein ACOYMF_13130 [Bacteroidales bacterium]
MKRKLRIILIAVLLITAPLLMLAQAPPHPNNGSAPTHGTNGPVGGGAPIGSGTIILIGLAGLYCANKVYTFRKVQSQ